MKYRVTIRATVTKTVEVEAENESEATEIAHQEFSVLNDGDEEKYEQDTVNVQSVL